MSPEVLPPTLAIALAFPVVNLVFHVVRTASVFVQVRTTVGGSSGHELPPPISISIRRLRFDDAERGGVTLQTIMALESNKHVPSLLLAMKIAREARPCGGGGAPQSVSTSGIGGSPIRASKVRRPISRSSSVSTRTRYDVASPIDV
jgi:DNA-binding XRE family transcriptional regulator